MVRRALEALKGECGVEATILKLAYRPELGIDEFILCLASSFLCLSVYLHIYV